MAESYHLLWQKTKLAFRYIHNTYSKSHDYDWILKIDDDSYVIMENLQLFVVFSAPASVENRQHSLQLRQGKDKPEYYGARYNARGRYNSGGPGYVISWTKLDALVRSFDMSDCQEGGGGAEDINIAGCLRKVAEVFRTFA